jgi:hypothetical protein
MRHCRSCSQLYADGNGELHMTKAAELHTVLGQAWVKVGA